MKKSEETNGVLPALTWKMFAKWTPVFNIFLLHNCLVNHVVLNRIIHDCQSLSYSFSFSPFHLQNPNDRGHLGLRWRRGFSSRANYLPLPSVSLRKDVARTTLGHWRIASTLSKSMLLHPNLCTTHRKEATLITAF